MYGWPTFAISAPWLSCLQRTDSEIGLATALSKLATSRTSLTISNSERTVDVEKASKCDFDHLVRYFVSLCLSGHAKLHLERLQSQIEVLQCSRQKGGVDGEKLNPSADETELLKQRDDILEELYLRCLNAVLPITEEKDLKRSLADFAETLKNPDKSLRYASYVELCNVSLSRLASTDISQLREASHLDFRFHCMDPLVGIHANVEANLKCEPGVGGSSDDYDFAQPPPPEKIFIWAQLLTCGEFRCRSHKLSSPAENALSESAFGLDRAITVDHNKLADLDKAASGQTQCASYALEMLSKNSGVHHVINLLFLDEYLWIWYYDRQGVIQSNGISVIADLPRFLVLLMAFQRFELEDWGIIPSLNPDALRQHGTTPLVHSDHGGHDLRSHEPSERARSYPVSLIELTLTDLDNLFRLDSNLESIDVSTVDYLSARPHCISGRATAVLRAKKKDAEDFHLACKISNPEVDRRHEGVMMRFLRRLVEAKDRDMFRHLPTLHFYGDVKGTDTKRIRSVLTERWEGPRITRVLALDILEKVTTLKGEEFVRAWLEAVTVHSFMWKYGVEHGDPSLSNIMFNRKTGYGQMSDFELLKLQWRPSHVPGLDRTGTIPFMAIDLLTKDYWAGETKRYYHHELEAFIWILPFVFLLYQDGKRQSYGPVDLWCTSDYITCGMLKRVFCESQELAIHGVSAQQDFQCVWSLASALCTTILKERFSQMYDGEDDKVHSTRMFDSFVEGLRSKLPPVFEPYVTGLVHRKPYFSGIMDPQGLKSCRETFKEILRSHQSSEDVT